MSQIKYVNFFEITELELISAFHDSYVQLCEVQYVNSSVIHTLCVEAGESAENVKI